MTPKEKVQCRLPLAYSKEVIGKYGNYVVIMNRGKRVGRGRDVMAAWRNALGKL